MLVECDVCEWPVALLVRGVLKEEYIEQLDSFVWKDAENSNSDFYFL